MKITYQNELDKLRKWIDNTKSNMLQQLQLPHDPQEVQKVSFLISAIATGIQSEYPFYSNALPQISSRLFMMNNIGFRVLNAAAFSELALIIRHIEEEPVAMCFGHAIHSRVTKVSYELFKDGHYASAAENAVKEVEVRLREKFSELKPGAALPRNIGDVIGALISENGAFKFCDITTTSGKDHRRGIQSLFEETMAAYRNPAAHANLQCNKREAMEQIMLASQLMFVLDKPQI